MRDLEPRARTLPISRVVVEVNEKFHPDGEGNNFLVKEYPSSAPDDLLFWFQDLTELDASSRTVANPDEPGLT